MYCVNLGCESSHWFALRQPRARGAQRPALEPDSGREWGGSAPAPHAATRARSRPSLFLPRPAPRPSRLRAVSQLHIANKYRGRHAANAGAYKGTSLFSRNARESPALPIFVLLNQLLAAKPAGGPPTQRAERLLFASPPPSPLAATLHHAPLKVDLPGGAGSMTLSGCQFRRSRLLVEDQLRRPK